MEGEQFHMDTLDHCFLCLKKVAPNSSAGQPNSVGREGNGVGGGNGGNDGLKVTKFDKVVKYLGIDFNVVLDSNFQEDLQDSFSDNESHQLFGKFCLTCAKETNDFNQLHRRMEEIHNEMVGAIGHIFERMEESCRDKERKDNFNDDMNRFLSTKLCRPFLNRLWYTVLHKCDRMLHSRGPRFSIGDQSGSGGSSKETLSTVAVSEDIPQTATFHSQSPEIINSVKAAYISSEDAQPSTSVLEPDSQSQAIDESVISSMEQDIEEVEVEAAPPNKAVRPTFNRKYVCSICPTPHRFRLKGQLKTHQNRVHEGKHKCSFCPKAFKRMGAFKSHVKRIHVKIMEDDYNSMGNNEAENATTANQKQCNFCQKTFRTKGTTERHKKLHFMDLLVPNIPIVPPPASSIVSFGLTGDPLEEHN